MIKILFYICISDTLSEIYVPDTIFPEQIEHPHKFFLVLIVRKAGHTPLTNINLALFILITVLFHKSPIALVALKTGFWKFGIFVLIRAEFFV